MRTVTYSEVRQNLAKMLDHVVDDAEEVVVTRSAVKPQSSDICGPEASPCEPVRDHHR
jgi:hypothetical protein